MLTLLSLVSLSERTIQSVLNAAAKLMCNGRKDDSISPLLLSDVHWASVPERTWPLLMFHCRNERAPAYLKETYNGQRTTTCEGVILSTSSHLKISKYCGLAGTHLFFPVAIETAGTWNQLAVALVQEIDRRITMVTEDTTETAFLFQRLSIALQRGNAVSFLSTFTSTE